MGDEACEALERKRVGMNVPTEIASKVVDSLKATPFVMALLIINLIMFGAFAYILHEISDAMERREKIIERCLR